MAVDLMASQLEAVNSQSIIYRRPYRVSVRLSVKITDHADVFHLVLSEDVDLGAESFGDVESIFDRLGGCGVRGYIGGEPCFDRLFHFEKSMLSVKPLLTYGYLHLLVNADVVEVAFAVAPVFDDLYKEF